MDYGYSPHRMRGTPQRHSPPPPVHRGSPGGYYEPYGYDDYRSIAPSEGATTVMTTRSEPEMALEWHFPMHSTFHYSVGERGISRDGYPCATVDHIANKGGPLGDAVVYGANYKGAGSLQLRDPQSGAVLAQTLSHIGAKKNKCLYHELKNKLKITRPGMCSLHAVKGGMKRGTQTISVTYQLDDWRPLMNNFMVPIRDKRRTLVGEVLPEQEPGVYRIEVPAHVDSVMVLLLAIIGINLSGQTDSTFYPEIVGGGRSGPTQSIAGEMKRARSASDRKPKKVGGFGGGRGHAPRGPDPYYDNYDDYQQGYATDPERRYGAAPDPYYRPVGGGGGGGYDRYYYDSDPYSAPLVASHPPTTTYDSYGGGAYSSYGRPPQSPYAADPYDPYPPAQLPHASPVAGRGRPPPRPRKVKDKKAGSNPRLWSVMPGGRNEGGYHMHAASPAREARYTSPVVYRETYAPHEPPYRPPEPIYAPEPDMYPSYGYSDYAPPYY